MKEDYFEHLDDQLCNCLKVRRAAQSITKIYDYYLAPSGLKISQYSLMKNISQSEPVNVSDLANILKLDRTTLVRNLKPLEERGLISDISPSSARNRQLVLTETGKVVLSTAIELWREAQLFVEQSLGKDNLETLTGLLSDVENLKV